METCIYKGSVSHRRFKPIKHYFSYRTFSILFDLDELESLQKKLAYFRIINLIFLAFTIRITETEVEKTSPVG